MKLTPRMANLKATQIQQLAFATVRCSASTLALLMCLTVAACGKHTSLPDEVRGLTLKTLTGEQIVLADVNGPILINFWATDCRICVHEMPSLTSLYERYSPEGFKLVAVAMPYDPPNMVLSMAEREQWPFPVALDVTGEVLESFATVKGTPTSFLLDKDGRLVKRYVGAVPMKKIRKELDSLLGLT